MFYIQRIRGLRRFPVEVNIKKKAIEGTRVSKIDKGPQIIKNKDVADRTTSTQSSSNNSLAEMQFSVFLRMDPGRSHLSDSAFIVNIWKVISCRSLPLRVTTSRREERGESELMTGVMQCVPLTPKLDASEKSPRLL